MAATKRKPKDRVKSLVNGELDKDDYDPMAELLKFRNLLVEEYESICNGGFVEGAATSPPFDGETRVRYTLRDHSAKILAEIQAIDRELMPYKYPKLRSQETKLEAGGTFVELLREVNAKK